MNLPILVVRAIRRKVYDALSLERMDKKFGVLAVNFVFLMSYFTLEGVFVNTLLLRISDGDFRVVLIYRSIKFAFSAMAMLFAAAFPSKMHPTKLLRGGGVLYMLSFAALFIWMERLTDIMYFLGAAVGIAAGLYFLGHNMLLTHYTTPSNRALGLSLMTIVQGSISLMMPLISGMVIGFMPDMIGYRIMFGLAILAAGAQVTFIRKLTPVAASKHKTELIQAIKMFFTKTTIGLIFILDLIRGLRDGVFMFFLNIVLFEIVGSESLVGFNSFLAGIAAISGAWLYGRVATAGNRAVLVGIATTVLMAFAGLLMLAMNPATIILFSVLNSFMVVIINNSATNTSFDILGMQAYRPIMTELMAVREVALQSGRIVGVLVVSSLPPTLEGYVQAMLVLTASVYLVAVLLHIIRLAVDKERRQGASEA